ncbi:MAG: hypothetical protein ACE5KK_02475 [Candidatus Brocadiales bacterium]
MGHGSHWECINKPVENLIPVIIPKTTGEGSLFEKVSLPHVLDSKEFEAVASLTYPEGDLRAMLLISLSNDVSIVRPLTHLPSLASKTRL